MKVYVGADHNGFTYKAELVAYLTKRKIEVIDVGSPDLQQGDDFPVYAAKVAHAVLADGSDNSRGLLICGSGQGMCMAANRFKGIRASLCWSVVEARSARNDDDSNVLCLSSRYTSLDDAELIIDTWLTTPFAEAARYKRRLKQLDNLS